MRGKARLAGVTILLLAMILPASMGCGSTGSSGDCLPQPGERADIRGYIAEIRGKGADAGTSALGFLLIEGEFEDDTEYDRASVTVTDKTRLLEEVDGELEEITFDELMVGQFVQAVFTGPVAESYPVQAAASEIVVLGSTAVGKVKDRHEAELFAISGVVGMGISSRDGEPVIVVFLEDDSPGLREAIPTELEGFKVITEVTGPIELLPL